MPSIRSLCFALLSAATAGLIFAPGDARATTQLPFDLVTQVADAELVFEGTVGEVWTCPNPDNGIPRTCASVAVDTFFKGRARSKAVVLFVPGGPLPDGRYVQFVGAPTLRSGERILASTFVKPDSEDMVALVNFQTALLRRYEAFGAPAVAVSGNERFVEAMPFNAAPRHLGAHSDSGESVADHDLSEKVATPQKKAAPAEAMLWKQARQAVVEALKRAPKRVIKTAQSARDIAGATPASTGK